MKKVGIIGGSGYTGGELIRLVLHHPNLELDFVYSTTRPGHPYKTHTEICWGAKHPILQQRSIQMSMSYFSVWDMANRLDFWKKISFLKIHCH